MAQLEKIRRRLESYSQSHLLQFYDQLKSPRQAALIEQIEAIDFELISQLVEKYVHQPAKFSIQGKIEPPQIEPAKPVDAKTKAQYKKARERGEQLITEGKVAAFVVAGGQGTRLGFDGPKGCFQATAVSKKPLFQLFAEQIRAAADRCGKPIRWYIMTSPDNDVPTRAFFRQHGYFGLSADDVFFFVQGTLPAIDFDGKILLAGKGSLALCPDGHGGSLLALARSGALEDMSRRGVELISYFQVDNPLVRVLDPLMLGLHDIRRSQMSAKCLPKRNPTEKLGNFCLVDGKVTVIEYSDMPDELARATTDDGHLRFSAGSIAIHVLSREFVEQLTKDSKCSLPMHRAEKKVPFIDQSGKIVKPNKPNAVKFEMFVFDAMPLAKRTLILETTRSREFSPIKNAQGEDSAVTSLHDQVRRSAQWLERAGVSIPRDADGQIAAAIEISPLLADSAEELAKKVDPNMAISPGDNLYLS